MSENLCLKSVRDICAKDSPLRREARAAVPQCPLDSNVPKEDENIGTYYIPSFQRGYRWTRLQVRQLVEDLREFYDANSGAWYSLQPLVVIKDCKEGEEVKQWKVIDGQQRLTTLFLIIKYLTKSNPYHIEYETRQDCWNFLKKIDENDNAKAKDNPDFFCISEAWVEIKQCLSGCSDKYKEMFCQVMRH